jgi:hypothetical protein
MEDGVGWKFPTGKFTGNKCLRIRIAAVPPARKNPVTIIITVKPFRNWCAANKKQFVRFRMSIAYYYRFKFNLCRIIY